MNIDTDTQWSFWVHGPRRDDLRFRSIDRAPPDVCTTQDGIREYEAANHDYLQQQIGNPDGADKPNKKYYDPRMCLRSAEEATVERLGAPRRPESTFAPTAESYAPSTRRLLDSVAV